MLEFSSTTAPTL